MKKVIVRNGKIVIREDEFDMENELEKGAEVEVEHEPTYGWLKSYVEEHKELPPAEELYKHIAQDHLNEFEKYYSALAEMEEKLRIEKEKEEEEEEEPEEKKYASVEPMAKPEEDEENEEEPEEEPEEE